MENQATYDTTNHLIGFLEFEISKETPRNILDLFEEMSKRSNNNPYDSTLDSYCNFSDLFKKSGIKELQQFITNDERKDKFPLIDYLECEDSIYIEVIVDERISVITDKEYDRIDKIIEAYIQLFKPYRCGISLENFISSTYNEMNEDVKGYYFDREELYKCQNDRSYLCKNCDQLNMEILCNNFIYCNRAYEIGRKQ